MIEGSDCVSRLRASCLDAPQRVRGSSKRSVAKELRQAIIAGSGKLACGIALRAWDASGRIASLPGVSGQDAGSMLRFVSAGESHGQALIAWISGLPLGVPVDTDFIQRELHRRQLGYGRGGRQRIEKDQADILAGVRHGKTIGAPIAVRIENRDWANWEKALPVEDTEGADSFGWSATRRLGRATPILRAR